MDGFSEWMEIVFKAGLGCLAIFIVVLTLVVGSAAFHCGRASIDQADAIEQAEKRNP